MSYALDLTKHIFKRELGDLTLYGTWIGVSLEDSEPALVIVPTHYGPVVPCCVTLSSAWRYNEPRYLLQAAMQFNQAMGREDSMTNVHRVASVIHDHLQDLIEMPPRPVEQRIAVAEATLTHESGRKYTTEIIEER